jgi:membrane associated rhomboid family serine protease
MLSPVVKNLLIINALFFLGSLVIGDKFGLNLTQLLGLSTFSSENFNPYQLITYNFMHGDFAHIFFNMFAVWMFGNVIESVWGSKRFLIYYMVTGIGAGVLHMLVTEWGLMQVREACDLYVSMPSPEAFTVLVKDHFSMFSDNVGPFVQEWMTHKSDPAYFKETLMFIEQRLEIQTNIPTVGASGAVFGLLLAFGMMFPNSIIYLYFAIPIKAKYFVMIYGALELYAGVMNQPGDNIAHFAHLGGMLFGFFMIKLWQKRRFRS